MRAPLIRLLCLLSLLIASSGSAVPIDWTRISNPGNDCDAMVFSGYHSCWGTVTYSYYIGTYEVTNAQYAEFLNAVAASDPYGLYEYNMGANDPGFYVGGINRNGSPGSYTYSLIPGRDNMPLGNVSYYNAERFANWLHNGKPTGAEGPGTTETGAYTITANAIANGLQIRRNPDAIYFLPNENEWYKAAFYDPRLSIYYDYPTGTDAQTTCAEPSAAPNQANCGGVVGTDYVGNVTPVGAYTNSASPYGTFDQAGNLSEWIEVFHQTYGGGFNADQDTFKSSAWDGHYARSVDPRSGLANVGFRLAALVPEPGTGLLVIAGLLGLVCWRRAFA